MTIESPGEVLDAFLTWYDDHKSGLNDHGESAYSKLRAAFMAGYEARLLPPPEASRNALDHAERKKAEFQRTFTAPQPSEPPTGPTPVYTGPDKGRFEVTNPSPRRRADGPDILGPAFGRTTDGRVIQYGTKTGRLIPFPPRQGGMEHVETVHPGLKEPEGPFGE